ncbi:MAG: S-methyl-5'-thioadenosine phosphorylase [Deltaproteobacteria bacterium]|nr:S-methyl-5'-thioadenosine phosphorylase [Deltaproteobacteria bacterium]
MSDERVLGVIGGSGLYELEGMTSVERVRVDTPFGEPSDEYVTGRLGDVRLVFLPRHGRGHRVLPHEINFRANIYGMKKLGVDWILSVSAVGSMRPDIRPGDFVIVDQFFDRTRARPSSFFGEGAAGHVQLADPVCPVLAENVHGAAVAAMEAVGTGAKVHKGGTYIVIDGPQFSTRAESRIYRSWGVDVIGMTNMPEAKLAREAEICYSTVALSTDYDCWHETEEDVSVEAVLAVIRRNVEAARELIRRLAPTISSPRTCGCASAARHALMTAHESISAETRTRLGFILGKYL